jgi:hypothetical protein
MRLLYTGLVEMQELPEQEYWYELSESRGIAGIVSKQNSKTFDQIFLQF